MPSRMNVHSAAARIFHGSLGVLPAQMQEHASIRRCGSDLYSTVELTFTDAILGSVMSVKTIWESDSKLVVPPGRHVVPAWVHPLHMLRFITRCGFVLGRFLRRFCDFHSVLVQFEILRGLPPTLLQVPSTVLSSLLLARGPQYLQPAGMVASSEGSTTSKCP